MRHSLQRQNIQEKKGGENLKKLLKITDLTFDKELYPRLKVGWQTAYQYAQAMIAGSIFPPIFVGKFRGKLYVIDGWHRIEANKLRKQEYIDAEIKNYSKKGEMFLEAIKRNSVHGRPLSVQEKVRLIWKLEQMDFEPKQISEVVKVPMDKIERFKARTVIGPDGKPVFLKSIVAKADAKQEDKLSVAMGIFNVRTVNQLLKQVIELLESNVFPLEDEETKELAVKLYGLLQQKLELTVAS